MARQDDLRKSELITPPLTRGTAGVPDSYRAGRPLHQLDAPFDLRANGWLADHPAVGLLLILLGLAGFSLLAYQLRTNGWLVQWDTLLAAQLHAMALKLPPSILENMTFGFFLGKQDLQILGFVLVLYFLHKRYWPELGMVVIGWMGGSLIWNWLIQFFNRPRPQQQLGMEVKTIPSFPSGHSMFALLAIGLLAYLLVPKMPSVFWKYVVSLLAILTILFVGFSRVLEGGHYLSDVLAGYAVGLAWCAAVYTLLEGAIRRRSA